MPKIPQRISRVLGKNFEKITILVQDMDKLTNGVFSEMHKSAQNEHFSSDIFIYNSTPYFQPKNL